MRYVCPVKEESDRQLLIYYEQKNQGGDGRILEVFLKRT